MARISKRMAKVAELLQQQVALCVRKEMHDPRLTHVTVTEVNVSPDLKNATVYFTVLDDKQASELESVLNKAAGFVRHFVSQGLSLKYLPQLHFIFDSHLQNTSRLQDILRDVDESPKDE